ncbi:class I SAM-dependent methyltransferase [Poriferisphaera sp. WC338]|uniref:class I SAM-dependent methyltransferase n=1 Tax=Poriferisphaera sp. WC338 TaxID=3425129 RepID=UPI003D816642
MTQPTHNRLYHDLAFLWPILSPPDHYIAEASIIQSIIEDKLADLLADAEVEGTQLNLTELGAGGGHTLYHLQDYFNCTAVDLAPDMLENCKHLNPNVKTICDDMRNFTLDEKQHIILIHDAIDYLLTENDIAHTLAAAYQNLTSGGVLLLAPTYTSETFDTADAATDRQSSERYDLTYTTTLIDPDPTDHQFEMHLEYHITDLKNAESNIEHDIHACGLFSNQTWMQQLKNAGFSAEIGRFTSLDEDYPIVNDNHDEDAPWSLFIGMKH